MVTREAVHARMAELKFKVYAGQYDLNIIGLRRMPGVTGQYDDLMTVSCLVDKKWEFWSWSCTTEPGGKYIVKPLHEIGAAVLVHDWQNLSSHTIGVHGATRPWAHTALVQTGNLRVWHDGNKDQVIDYGLKETLSRGTSGINIHRNLGDFSAGCQVFKSHQDFEQFINLCQAQVGAGKGNRFSYTVLAWPTANF